MRVFNSSTNDGTLLITTKVDRPMQGTLVCNTADGKVVGKGIIRPPIITSDMQEEDEALVEDAAFKRSFVGCTEFEFYTLNSLSDQKCNLNRQAIYFACKNPAAFIEEDNKRFDSLSAFDFVSKEASKKIAAGISPSLLIETAAVWNMFERFEVTGIRSLAIASELVPDGAFFGLTPKQRMEKALSSDAKYIPSFMFMQDTAKSLAKKIGCSVNDLVGKYWLLHRDPALPTGETLAPMLCVGLARWKTGSKHEGLIFHPANPYWKAMGGDFDGDYAVCIQPTKFLEPRGSIPRADYKLKGKKYDSDNILDRIIQDAEDSTTMLLGPVILAITKLVERGLDTDDLRSIAASVAQGSIDAKKHVVDNDTIANNASIIFSKALEGSAGGNYPYITDIINELSNTKSYELKVVVWNKLITFLPYWEKHGTDLEKALCNRARKLNQLFADIEFFRHQSRVKLPSFITNAAKNLVSPIAAQMVRELTETHNHIARGLGTVDNIGEDKESYVADIREQLKIINTKFQVLAVTGFYNGQKVSPVDAQMAIAAYGPARIAAKVVSSEVFESLGKKTKRLISVLVGHNWENGIISVDKLEAIPSMQTELKKFTEGFNEVEITLIKQSPNSTRVVVQIIDSK